MYWHKKIHSLDWACEECDIRLNRKWNFKRHLLEVHGIEFHEIDSEIENEAQETGRQEKDTISVSVEKGPFSCSCCNKKFTGWTDLETHLSEHSLQQQEFTCNICGKTYTRKYNLQQHIKLVHMMEEALFPCRHCGKVYNRKDTLTRHERTVHCDE